MQIRAFRVSAAGLLVAAACATPRFEPVSEVVWLEQGWSAEERTEFHHKTQGTMTIPIRYEWFAALAFLPLCLLLSPVTWKAHHATLLPFLFALVELTRAGPRPPVWLVPGLWTYYVSCNLLSTELIGDRAGDFLQAVSLVTWADVALVIASLVLLARGLEGNRTSPRPGGA